MILWRDVAVRESMALCAANHSFLFQARPDLLPQQYLTETELFLWSFHYEQMKKNG